MWLKDSYVLSTGFDATRQREVRLRDTRNFSRSLKSFSFDASTGYVYTICAKGWAKAKRRILFWSYSIITFLGIAFLFAFGQCELPLMPLLVEMLENHLFFSLTKHVTKMLWPKGCVVWDKSYFLVSFYHSDMRYTNLQIVLDNWFVFCRVIMPFFDADTNMLFLAGKVKKFAFLFPILSVNTPFWVTMWLFSNTVGKSPKIRKYSYQCPKYQTKYLHSFFFSMWTAP